jgi:hypothetical protein
MTSAKRWITGVSVGFLVLVLLAVGFTAPQSAPGTRSQTEREPLANVSNAGTSDVVASNSADQSTLAPPSSPTTVALEAAAERILKSSKTGFVVQPQPANHSAWRSAPYCLPVVRNVRALFLQDLVHITNATPADGCVMRSEVHLETRHVFDPRIAPSNQMLMNHYEPLYVNKSGSHRKFRTVITFALWTCITNMWHGTTEILMPIVDALIRLDAVPKELSPSQLHGAVPDGPLLLVELPPNRKSFWGGHACTSIRNPPFGFFGRTAATPVGWMLSKLVSGVRFMTPAPGMNVSYLNAHAPPFEGIADIDQLALSVSKICTKYPSLDIPPFFDVEGGPSDLARACTPVQQTLRRLLRAVMPPPTRPESPGSARGALNVVYLDRSNLRNNGRGVVNADSLLDALRGVCERSRLVAAPGRPTCIFHHMLAENMPIAEQLQIIADADVLVMPRGAGSVYANVMRPGSGFLAFIPYFPDVPLSVPKDNHPWWPMSLLRNDMSVRNQVCVAELKRKSNCEYRSVNFCNMRCSADNAERLLSEVLEEVWTGNVTNTLPAYRCERNTTLCVYTDVG